jgi:hypothetical protein
MGRALNALLAGAAAFGLLSTLPASAQSREHSKATAKTTTHAATHATVRAPAHASATHVTHVTHVTTHATKHATTHATKHATTRVTTRGYERTHPRTSARFTAPRRAVTHGIARATVTRIEDESEGRLHEIGRTATPIEHVTLNRTALRTVVVRRPALSNARFVTGTVVSRTSSTVVLRTAAGNTVTIVEQVPVVETAIVPGATVVLPVQYLNNQIVLVPSFTTAQEAVSAEPMLAPCAINDNDADDAGDSSYYAPVNACLNNDGDADDGIGLPLALQALPSSFGSLPQIFTSSYAPAVAAGFVVAQVGQNLILMTPNFKPLVVNASAVSGVNVSPGQYVVAYGFNVNNQFVATTLM